MIAAVSLVLIFALSFFLVRVFAVALRLTGLPEHSARFQAISALTGTGFTTSEAEMIVNYPIRRRIIVVLMLFGNLGIVSVLHVDRVFCSLIGHVLEKYTFLGGRHYRRLLQIGDKLSISEHQFFTDKSLTPEKVKAELGSFSVLAVKRPWLPEHQGWRQ